MRSRGEGGRVEHAPRSNCAAGGALPLPVISNEKTVDPRDKKSTPVLQLETAMGAAIECFPKAQVWELRGWAAE